MKKFAKYIIIIFLLIAIDQGAKLIVENAFYGNILVGSEINKDSINNVKREMFQICPIINERSVQTLQKIADVSKINIQLLILLNIVKNAIITALLLVFLYGIYRFLSKRKVKIPQKLINSVIYLAVAAWACRSLDNVLRGGTLDFLCVSWKGTRMTEDHIQSMTYFGAFDITDIYLRICMLLLAVIFILLVVRILKLSKEERKELDKEIKQSLKNIFKKDSTKNNKLTQENSNE